MIRLAFILALLAPVTAHAAALSIEKPWMRFLLPSLPASGYMILQNSGNVEETLTAAASPACGGGLMLHESQDNSGMAAMMAVSGIDIPAHGQIVFAPGGYHLMCMQPKMKIGDQVPVKLTFADGSTLSTSMPVYGAQTAP